MKKARTLNPKALGNPGLIFVISGPSGSGKTTLVKKLLARGDLQHKLTRSISLTTRPRRPGERNKKDYFFISAEQFRHAKKAQNLLEWTKYLGHYYATPKAFIKEQLQDGRNIILCLDLKGALALKQRYPGKSVTIFVLPPSLDTLLQRMAKRGDHAQDEETRERLKLGQEELRAAGRYDYCLVNKDLAQTTRQLKGIIFKEIGRHIMSGAGA